MTFADLTAVSVDDSPIQADKISSVLAGIGVRVVGKARDGNRGLQLIKAVRPRLAFIDIVMPLVTGIDVLRGMREAKVDTVPIMCSSMHIRDLENQCAALGAEHFIIKPYDEIITAIDLDRMLRGIFPIE